MEKYKIMVCSIKVFQTLMEENGLDDSNVEVFDTTAFVSIVSHAKKSIGEMYFRHGVGDVHYFKENHANVINLDIDDVEADFEDAATVYKAITAEQADDLVSFIKNNEHKDFVIHCHAGISRSGGVALFLFDHFDWVDREDFRINVLPRILPNMRIYRALTNCFEESNLL
ncbi:MAG: hypothetical protein LBO69_02685 [Ignavibacteria bacterium]|jgi:predicted protein tyrosine phosphatase|nr:hypothetical protein [Ignavibacteria bacterium]